jgi:drug/metabolite transporter (DMT)-like permease
MNAVKY